MEASDSSEMLVPICYTVWRHISERNNFHSHRYEKLKSQDIIYVSYSKDTGFESSSMTIVVADI